MTATTMSENQKVNIAAAPAGQETGSKFGKYAATVATAKCEMREAEGEWNYKEAEVLRLKMEDAKEHALRFDNRSLARAHAAERKLVEEARVEETALLTGEWATRVAEFEERATGIVEALKQKHHKERAAFLEEATADVFAQRPKFCSEYFDLRVKQVHSAKQCQYVLADGLKDDADAIQSRQKEEWKTKCEKRVTFLQKQLKQRQQGEMTGLVARIASGRQEQHRSRDTDLERLALNYANVKAALEAQHSRIRTEALKYSRVGNNPDNYFSTETKRFVKNVAR